MVSGLTKLYSIHMPSAAEHAGEHEHLRRRDLAARQRAPRGARHARVDLALDQAVDRERRAGQQPDADGAGDQRRASGHHAGHRQEHADHRAEHGQLRDARLGQRPVLGNAATGGWE